MRAAMMTFLPWVVLLLARNRDPASLSRAGAEVTRACNLAKGRVLGFLVRNGMTAEQVVAILGPADAGSGDTASFSAFYHDYGLSVWYSPGPCPPGVHGGHVAGVGFEPFPWPRGRAEGPKRRLAE
jgi:hypothetical protein